MNFKQKDPYFKVVHISSSLNHMAVIVSNSIMDMIQDHNKELPKQVNVI